jgi:antitoxin (DNA-binding transcriptional repressor) of toxin-antitoxin stability system
VANSLEVARRAESGHPVIVCQKEHPAANLVAVESRNAVSHLTVTVQKMLVAGLLLSNARGSRLAKFPPVRWLARGARKIVPPAHKVPI